MEPVTYVLPFAAASTRGTIEIGGLAPIRLLVGTGWSSTAAQIRPRVSEDGTTFYPLYDSDNAAYTVTVSAGRAYILQPSDFVGVTHLRLLGTTAQGTASAQSTACTVTIVARAL
jgi:hypothetical protein